MKFRPTEIDFEIHKLIETERRSFTESDNDILRRLLGLAEAAEGEEGSGSVPGQEGAQAAWMRDGAMLPHGTLLRMTYNGQLLEGRVENGSLVVNGRPFGSPSGAAMGNVRTKSGKRTSVDGWMYWHVKRPQDHDYIPLATLRDRAA